MLTSVRHGNALQCQGLGLGMEAAVRKQISKIMKNVVNDALY